MRLGCVLVCSICPTLCNTMDYSLRGSSVHEIFQARILEWVANSFSRSFPDQGLEPMSPALQMIFFFFFFTTGATWEALFCDGDLHIGCALNSGWDHCVHTNVFADTNMYLDSQAVGNGEQVFKLSKLPKKMGINRPSSREMVFHQSPSPYVESPFPITFLF